MAPMFQIEQFHSFNTLQWDFTCHEVVCPKKKWYWFGTKLTTFALPQIITFCHSTSVNAHQNAAAETDSDYGQNQE